jgi:hypothetical protein
MMKRAVVVAIAVLGVLAVAGPAMADTVGVKYTGVSPNKTVNLHFETSTGHAFSGSYLAGIYNLQLSSPNPDPGLVGSGARRSYCIDIQDESSTKLLTYNVHEVKDAPVVGTGETSVPMGATRAAMLGEMWGEAFAKVGNPLNYDATTAAAFQLAVWEVVWDGNLTLSDTTDNPDFWSGTTGTIRTLANQFLGYAAVDDWTDMPLVALTHYDPAEPDGVTDAQDYVIPKDGYGDVPGPAMLVQLIGLAAMGLVGWRRRRK